MHCVTAISITPNYKSIILQKLNEWLIADRSITQVFSYSFWGLRIRSYIWFFESFVQGDDGLLTMSELNPSHLILLLKPLYVAKLRCAMNVVTVFVDWRAWKVQLFQTGWSSAGLPWLLELQRHESQLRSPRAASYSRQDIPLAHCQRRFLVFPQLHPRGTQSQHLRTQQEISSFLWSCGGKQQQSQPINVPPTIEIYAYISNDNSCSASLGNFYLCVQLYALYRIEFLYF